jgi:hypothetical protein
MKFFGLSLKENIFATFECVKQYDKVGYYTIKGSTMPISEFKDFYKRMSQEDKDQVLKIIYWLSVIGNEYGAMPDYFRPERNCHAVPPPIEITQQSIAMRLYCYLVDENIVVLFNGGLKTNNNPEKCPNVRQYFKKAQKWAINTRDLIIQRDKTRITNLDDLQIVYA